MSSSIIANPTGAFRPSPNYATFLDADGYDLARDLDRTVETWQAGGTISAGDAVYVSAVGTSAGVPPVIAALPVDATLAQQQRYIGVALDSAVSGDKVDVVTRGPVVTNLAATETNIGSGSAGTAVTTMAFGTACTATAASGNTAGQVNGVTPTASTITGTILGFALTAEVGTTNKFVMYVEHR